MRKIVALTVIAIAIVCSGVAISVESTSTRSPEWQVKMQRLFNTLSELLIDVSSDKRFADPANRKKIEANTKLLAEIAGNLNTVGKNNLHAEMGAMDPTVPIVANLFAEGANRAYKELKRGNTLYARDQLKSISGYCIGCHTRNKSGPEFSGLAPEVVAALLPIEKAEYLAATRQYDAAFKQFMSIISDSAVINQKQLEWERAIYYALAIAVRVEKDISKSTKVVNQVLAAKEAPLFMKADAVQWKKSIKEWKREKRKAKQSPKDMLIEARSLVAKAHELQVYPTDHNADIYFLRASTILHEYLRSAAKGPQGEALLLLGQSYESLQDLNLWTLHELFYEACIQSEPHSKVAEACYKEYRDSLNVSYAGSSGVSIPPSVNQHLHSLKKLANQRK